MSWMQKVKRNAVLAAAISGALSASASAATWVGGTSSLWNVKENWSTNTVPTDVTTIAFDNTTQNLTVSINATNPKVYGVEVLNPSGNLIIGNAGGGSQFLNIGAGGIDMSQATKDLTFNQRTTLLANQIWTIAEGRTLTVNHSTVGSINLGNNLTLTLNGNGNLTANTAIIGAADTTPGTVIKNGTGTLTLAGGGNKASSNLTINAGTLKIGTNTSLGGSEATANNVVLINSGATLDLNGVVGNVQRGAANTVLVTINGMGVNNGGALINSSTSQSVGTHPTRSIVLGSTSAIGGAGALEIFSPIIDNGGGYGVVKVGAGELKLSNTGGWLSNSYTGATEVKAGKLTISGSIVSSSGVTVDFGARLRSIGGAAPGSASAVEIKSGGIFETHLLSSGTDKLNVSSLSLQSGALLDIQLEFVPTLGNSFTVIDGSSITGTFAGLAEGKSKIVNYQGADYAFQISYANGDVTLTNVVVPEPATGILFAGAAAVLLGGRRRRHQ